MTGDPERHAQAWRSLAPPGDDLEGRQTELSHLCQLLFRKGRTPDEMLGLFLIIQSYLTEDECMKPGTLARNRQLAEDASVAARHAKSALHELIRVCREAEDANPLRFPDAPRRDELSWTESRRRLEDALALLDVAPGLVFLRRFEERPGVAGDPVKRRNGKMRAELEDIGLTREQVTTILRALRFISRRTDGPHVSSE